MRKIFVGVGIIVGLLVATSIQSLAQDDLLAFCMHDQTGAVRLDTECTTQETPYNLPSEKIVQSIVPAGTIVMWSGAIGDIPEGWALCDGTAPTPDLTDKFIVGAGDGTTYAVGNTGGQDAVTLAINNMPTHSHDVSTTYTSYSGSHSHSAGSYRTNNSGYHRHSYLDRYWDGTEYVGGALFRAADNDTRDINRNTGYAGTHNHSVIGQSASVDDHRHSLSGSTNDSGGSGAIDIRPTYYALAFIMKLPPLE